MFSPIQSLLLHIEAVRKREDSSFSHLYANPEASGTCLGSISGCNETSTLTRLLRFTWLLSRLPLFFRFFAQGKTSTGNDKKKNNNFWIQIMSVNTCIVPFVVPHSIRDTMDERRAESAGTFNIASKMYNPGHQTVQSPGCQRCTM